MLTFSSFILLIVFLLNLVVGFFILFQDYRQRINQLFFLFVFFLSLWIFPLFVRAAFLDIDLLFWTKLTFLGPFAIPSVFALFCLYFPRPVDTFRFLKPFFSFLLFLSIVFSFLSFKMTSIGPSETWVMFYYFPLYFFSVLGYSFYTLFVSYRKSIGVVRAQVQYLFFAFALLAIVSSITNVVLPVFFQISNFNFIGPLSTFFFFVIVAYAIVRHQLMDIRVVIKKSIIFSALVLIIAGFYTVLFTYLGQILIDRYQVIGQTGVGFIAAFVIVLIYNPIRSLLEKLTDKFLFRGEYHSYSFLSDISRRLSSSLRVDDILQVIEEGLDQTIRIRQFALYLYESEEREKLYLARIRGWARDSWRHRSMFHEMLIHKCLGDIVDLELVDQSYRQYDIGQRRSKELPLPLKYRDSIAALIKDGALFVIPLRSRQGVLGLFIIGHKKSGDIYGRKDSGTLITVASQAAIALSNAQLYQKMQQFNVRLRKEVAVATARLEKQNEELRRLDDSKSEFVSIASHQLRTPLTSIRGYTSMVIEGDYGRVSKKVKEPLVRVLDSTERLIRLVNELLNLSRIESGKLQYDLQKVNLTESMDSLCHDFESHAEDRGLEYICEIPKKPIYVSCDIDKLYQVFQNIVDNSIKYTPEGSIKLKLVTSKKKAIFSVTDTGVGIDPKEKEQIFQKFVRGKGMARLHTGGSGIGLYIAKQILEVHKGVILIESKGKGHGSTFIVELPLI